MTKPTFATLRQLLFGLGFTTRGVPGSHILFERSEPNFCLVLRDYQPEDPFDLAELAYVRSTLAHWGLLTRAEFDERVGETALVS